MLLHSLIAFFQHNRKNSLILIKDYQIIYQEIWPVGRQTLNRNRNFWDNYFLIHTKAYWPYINRKAMLILIKKYFIHLACKIFS